MLRELQLDGTTYDKTAIAIERIKTMAPIAENIYGGYTVCVSGGKDSTVITDLAIRSRVKCRFKVSWTGIEYITGGLIFVAGKEGDTTMEIYD